MLPSADNVFGKSIRIQSPVLVFFFFLNLKGRIDIRLQGLLVGPVGVALLTTLVNATKEATDTGIRDLFYKRHAFNSLIEWMVLHIRSSRVLLVNKS